MRSQSVSFDAVVVTIAWPSKMAQHLDRNTVLPALGSRCGTYRCPLPSIIYSVGGATAMVGARSWSCCLRREAGCSFVYKAVLPYSKIRTWHYYSAAPPAAAAMLLCLFGRDPAMPPPKTLLPLHACQGVPRTGTKNSS